MSFSLPSTSNFLRHGFPEVTSLRGSDTFSYASHAEDYTSKKNQERELWFYEKPDKMWKIFYAEYP